MGQRPHGLKVDAQWPAVKSIRICGKQEDGRGGRAKPGEAAAPRGGKIDARSSWLGYSDHRSEKSCAGQLSWCRGGSPGASDPSETAWVEFRRPYAGCGLKR